MRAARRVTERLRERGHEAWIAGGAVRDLLLGREPRDADVATSARPAEVEALWPGSRLVGAAFGVVLVPQDGEWIEVATFRREGPYRDGRRPESVEYGTLEEDARRRDFTVNGLYLDPATGEVRDLVGGRDDLAAGTIRAIGDAADRFRDDHLRLLRAVRFAAELGFALEEGTAAAVRGHGALAADVAPERTRDELLRILTGPDPARGVELLHDTGLLAVVLPEVAGLAGVEQPPEYHPEGDVLVHTLGVLRHLESPSPELALGALLHDVGKAATFVRAPDRIRFPRHARVGAETAAAICRRLRLPNAARERVTALVAEHMRFQDVARMRPSTLKRFLRQPGFEEHLALHRADCLGSHGRLDNWEFARRALSELGEEKLRPPRLVTGRDLLELGWTPGPALGRELARIEELQLEGKLRDRDEALAVAREDLERGGEPGD